LLCVVVQDGGCVTRHKQTTPYWDIEDALVRKTQVAGRLLREIASTVVPGGSDPVGWGWPLSELVAHAYAGTDEPDGDLAELILTIVEAHLLPGTVIPEAGVEPLEPLFVQPGPRRLRSQ
jgi:hypothetical protein